MSLESLSCPVAMGRLGGEMGPILRGVGLFKLFETPSSEQYSVRDEGRESLRLKKFYRDCYRDRICILL